MCTIATFTMPLMEKNLFVDIIKYSLDSLPR